MKPDAPDTVRGEFRPAAMAVPGIRVCEHLPRFARVMDKVCLVRSMTHRMNAGRRARNRQAEPPADVGGLS